MSNTNLLEVVNFDDTIKTTRNGRVQPQMMEFQVNPELAPFLVSSTRAVMWVEKAGTSENVRAAVRARRGLEAELVGAIIDMGTQVEWGNIHPLTTMGVKACVDHLHSYGLEQVEVLISSDTEIKDVDFKKLKIIEASWVPVDVAIIVPVDRGFVGTLGTLGKHKALALIHNASRGVGIVHR